MLWCILLGYYSLNAQNPNWTLPGQFLNHDIPQLQNLPQPTGSDVYQGDPADFVHSAYTNPFGEIQFFTVDEFVYDENGYEVWQLLDDTYTQKEGFNERLILPMGDDCRRFAIIFRSRLGSQAYNNQLCVQSLYMAIYDTQGINNWNTSDPVIGALEEYNTNSQTLIDISKRDGELYHQNGLRLYGYNDLTPNPTRTYNTNIQVAATGLIEGCYYRVYVFDGQNLIKYHLTETDLEWQGVIQQVPRTGQSSSLRSEMELIELASGDYRIAIPTVNDGTGGVTDKGITIYDLDGSTGNVISGSEVYLDYENGSTTHADPYGLEFDATGRYLYVTNATNSVHTDLLEVYDFNTSAYVSTSFSMTALAPFQKSFIERFGNDLYLASATHIGRIPNASGPGTTFDATFQSLSGTYGNDVGYSGFQRFLLPEQLDMTYPDVVEDMSCICCKDYNFDKRTHNVTSDVTWTVNPFTGTGTDVYIGEELRIEKGVTLTLVGLNFYFGNDAKVIVEQGDGITDGGRLVMDNTLFSVDTRCNDRIYADCQEPDECEEIYWQGVRVLGVDTDGQSTTIGNQGKLVMKANSQIEYAYIGVRAGNEDCTDCGGGVLEIYDSKFKDNDVGVRFDPYVRTINGSETYNLGFIRNTNFTRTTDVPVNSKLTHVHAIDCSTIRLRGNIYQNEAWQYYNLISRGTGILSQNSSIEEKWYCSSATSPCPEADMVGSTFENLYKGIDATSSLNQRTVYAAWGTYRNNHSGMQLNGLQDPQALENDFFVPNLQNGVGIFLNGSTGYAVEGNYFTSVAMSPVAWNFGVAVHSSGIANNEIYRNLFEDLAVGIVSQGVNADCATAYDNGLRWRCNQFNQTMPFYDIYVHDGNVSDDQGSCTSGPTGPAGNIFSHSTYSGHEDLFVNPANLITCPPPNANFEVVYRYHTPSNPFQSRFNPVDHNFPYVQPVQCAQVATTATCPVQNTTIDQVQGPKSAGSDGSKSLDLSEMTEWSILDFEEGAAILYADTESVDEDSDLAQEKYRFWHGLIRASQWDSLGQFPKNDVLELLNDYMPLDGERYASILSADTNTPVWINESNNSEMDVFMSLPTLDDENLLPSDLTDYYDAGFFSQASNVAALNALYIEHEATYETRLPEMPTVEEWPESFVESGNKALGEENQKDPVVVVPNPFEDVVYLNVSALPPSHNVRVVIHDLNGNLISDQTFSRKDLLMINGQDYPQGIMIYSIYLDGKFSYSGKIVKLD